MSEQVAYTTISRKEAKFLGLTKYYTGKPCKNGHIQQRWTANGICDECHRKVKKSSDAKYLAANKESIHAYKREYRRLNRDAINADLKRRYLKDKPSYFARAANRRSYTIKATPFWSDLKVIEQIYYECARISENTNIPHHVDHIVPLNHKLVCGLHVPANLRIITAEENLSKGNKFEIE